MVKRSTRTGDFREAILRWGSLSLLFVPFAVYAAGQSRQDKTFATTAAPRIRLSNFMGHVQIKGWTKPQVHAVYATASPLVFVDLDELPQAGPAEKIHFTTRLTNPEAGGVDKTVFYALEVPLGASLEIRNPEGRVDIEKIQGDASVDSVGGIISVSDVAGHLAVNSISGDIEVIRPAGRVEATSICGNLHFVSPTSSWIKGNTSSGKITYEGNFVSGGEYALTNYSGDINLLVPPSASFELNKRTVRGKFISEIAPATAKRPRPDSPYPGAHTFLGSNVSSTATVRLSSFSGNISIRRQP